MHSKLRIRLSKNPKIASSKQFVLTEKEIRKNLPYIRPDLSEQDIEDHITNFTVSAKLINSNNFFPDIDPCYFFTTFEFVIFDIHCLNINFLGQGYRENLITLLKEKLANYDYQSEIKFTYMQGKDTPTIEVNVSKLWQLINRKPVSLKPVPPNIDTKYRLYLDNKMLIERIFPTELGFRGQIEEILFVDIKPGPHELRVESIIGNIIYLHNVAVDKQIFYIGAEHGTIEVN